MNTCFRAAYRHNSRILRDCREREKLSLVFHITFAFEGGVFISRFAFPGGEYSIVWEESRKCGWVRVISRWDCLHFAVKSAQRLIRRRREMVTT